MIVHCSAGIGRTGVIILMDTALALMEAREPVYPLDIVRTMRDQRACMVQNVVRKLFLKHQLRSQEYFRRYWSSNPSLQL